MHTIVVNSQKGGSGKTTLCAHLSVQAQRAGDGEVFLIDTDPQGTLTTWHEKREAEAPRRVELPFDEIESGRVRGVGETGRVAPARTRVILVRSGLTAGKGAGRATERSGGIGSGTW